MGDNGWTLKTYYVAVVLPPRFAGDTVQTGITGPFESVERIEQALRELGVPARGALAICLVSSRDGIAVERTWASLSFPAALRAEYLKEEVLDRLATVVAGMDVLTFGGDSVWADDDDDVDLANPTGDPSHV